MRPGGGLDPKNELEDERRPLAMVRCKGQQPVRRCGAISARQRLHRAPDIRDVPKSGRVYRMPGYVRAGLHELWANTTRGGSPGGSPQGANDSPARARSTIKPWPPLYVPLGSGSTTMCFSSGVDGDAIFPSTAGFVSKWDAKSTCMLSLEIANTGRCVCGTWPD